MKLARNERMQERRITETAAHKLAFNHTGESRFGHLDNASLRDGQLWVPSSQTFESIDALSQHGLFQITTARSGKSINYNGLAAAAEHWKKVMGAAPLRLFIVVPQEMSGLYQNALSIKSSDKGKVPPKVPHEQYVVWFEG
mmetsp:Transcript_18640/g.39486  ORF Transcript_18640/g.39486 Transcript_18640/m.39486 type:complete len:141 (+) Transcript_18640:930-1352(+)